MMALVIFLFLFVALYDWLALLRKCSKKIIIIYIVFLAASLALLMPYILEKNIPSPLKPVHSAIEAIIKVKGQ